MVRPFESLDCFLMEFLCQGSSTDLCCILGKCRDHWWQSQAGRPCHGRPAMDCVHFGQVFANKFLQAQLIQNLWNSLVLNTYTLDYGTKVPHVDGERLLVTTVNTPPSLDSCSSSSKTECLGLVGQELHQCIYFTDILRISHYSKRLNAWA